jgi:hypothetical protein
VKNLRDTKKEDRLRAAFFRFLDLDAELVIVGQAPRLLPQNRIDQKQPAALLFLARSHSVVSLEHDTGIF